MLKASYSWRGNNIIRKRIPRTNDTVTKNDHLYLKWSAAYQVSCYYL